MVRRTLKTLAWTAGGLIGVAVAIYVAAIVVNLRDQPPSPAALKLSESYETRPLLADDDNAFIYLLGFDAPLTDDPRDIGARRLAWLQSKPFDEASDPRTMQLHYLSTDPIVEQFLDVCGSDTRDCSLAFTGGDAVFQAWNATHPWLLERYLQLIAHSGWREEVSDFSAPLPPFAHAIHAQRLLLLRAKLFAEAGDTSAAGELIASDARFWRTVLASTDFLITKMVATAALRQHFAWGSSVARAFPPGSVATDIPDEWRRPMTEAELSLRRTLVGEWVYFSNIPALEYASVRSEDSFAARTWDRLLHPLFQHQATLNRHAAYLDELANTLDAPLGAYADVSDRASELARRTADDAFPPRSLYNIVGSLMMAVRADYAPYADRVRDLEGMRRGALTVVLLRDNGVSTSQVPDALAASPLRNPYDDAPLRWDAEEQAVVFVGLEPGERGEHRFYY